MKVEGTHELHASLGRVYETLIDPAVLQRCIPGCERLEKTGENAYSATLRTGVGSIKGLFTGNVRLEDLKPPRHFRIRPAPLRPAGAISPHRLSRPRGGPLQ